MNPSENFNEELGEKNYSLHKEYSSPLEVSLKKRITELEGLVSHLKEENKVLRRFLEEVLSYIFEKRIISTKDFYILCDYFKRYNHIEKMLEVYKKNRMKKREENDSSFV